MAIPLSAPPPMLGPSVADSLPSIAFGFDDLRARMSQFTSRFDDFINTGRKDVLEARNQFRINVAEIHEQSHLTQQKLENLAQQSSTHEANIGREAAETAELREAVTNLTNRKEASASVKQRLQAGIREIQSKIEARQQEQRAYDERMEEQRRLNGPELRFWTDNLCMKIEACNEPNGRMARTNNSSTDRLKIIFTHVDEANWEKECWFELEMSGGASGGYNVGLTKPKLEREEIGRVLELMNTNSNLAKFLAGMRSLFTKATKEGR